jgi:predicted phage tail protein
MREQTTIRPVETRHAGTGVLVRVVLAGVAGGGLRLGRLALGTTVRAARLVRRWWYPACGAVLVALAVAGLLAMLAAPLLIATTGAR